MSSLTIKGWAVAALLLVVAAASGACGSTVDRGAPATGTAGEGVTTDLSDRLAVSPGMTTAGPGGRSTAGTPASTPSVRAQGDTSAGSAGTAGATSGGATATSQAAEAPSAGAPPGPSTPAVTATTGGTSQPAPGSPATTTHPGIDENVVRVGSIVFDPAAVSAASQAIGAEGTALSDPRAAVSAIVEAVNADGGVAGGRQVEVVWHEINVANDNNTEAQSQCATFTEDINVLAVAGAIINLGSPLVPCLADHDTIGVGTSIQAGTTRDFAAYPDHYYAPATIELGTGAVAMVDGALDQGWLDPGPTQVGDSNVGLLTFDFPEYLAAREDTLLPALAARGIEVVAERQISYSGSLNDYGAMVAQIQAAVLAFRSASITHVLPVDYNGVLFNFFAQGAENQSYRPRYAISTTSSPQYQAGSVPIEQLAGTVGAGWFPSVDLPQGDVAPSPAGQRCLDLLAAADIAPQSSADMTIMLGNCSTWFLIEHALDHASTYDVAGFRAVVDTLGATGVTAAADFTDTYGPDKHWGAAAYRPMAFDTTCTCFDYTEGERSVG